MGAWVLLAVASALEIVWVIAMKYTEGFTRMLPLAVMLVAMAGSVGLLGLAVRDIPVGTGYAVWTGIGAVGVAIYGIAVFAEPLTLLRVGGILTVVVGIAMLRVTA